MKRLIPFAWLLVSALLVLGARQEGSVADKVIDEGKNRSEVMAHLDHLTNGIGPRLTSSDKLTRACSWARHQFEAWGLQNCRLEQWGTYPVGFNRGPWKGKMTAPEELDLTFITMSWTPGTNGPVEGLAVMGPSTEAELAAVEPLLKGAWVLSPGTSTSKELNEKILEAYDKAGIAGLIRRGGQDLLVTGGNGRIAWDKLPKRVNIVLQRPHYDKVKGLIGDGKKVTLLFDIKNEFVKGPIPLYNVLAEIPGTEKPEEMVIVGGHLDSWDGATGTTDNGTGSATTMEAARLLMKAGAKPKRTIRFMLWSGEEQG
ncbi:MAG TPA: M28 family peptidase, partial [Planctomycetota bacterium]|nr:M28 family peptidase [Planctomycetota bacterium]